MSICMISGGDPSGVRVEALPGQLFTVSFYKQGEKAVLNSCLNTL